MTGPDPAYADVRNGVGLDDFDAWSASRDRRYERPRATAYVSPQMVGYADLDAVRQLGVDAGLRARLVSERGRARLGAVSRRLLDQCRRVGLHLGRCRAMGLRAVPLWSLGVGRAVAGAGARERLSRGRVGRPRWWAGSAARAGDCRVNAGAPVYGWVPLGWGEPFHPWWGHCSYNCWATYNRPVRGQRRDAAGESAVALPQCRFSQCGDRCFRRHAAEAAACRVQSGARCRRI